MEYYYSCGCVYSFEQTDVDFCPVHGRKYLSKGSGVSEPRDETPLRSAYDSITAIYGLGSSLDIDLDSFDLILVDSATSLLRKLPKVPIIISGLPTHAIDCLQHINLRKHSLEDSGTIHLNTEYNKQRFEFFQSYYILNAHISMPHYSYCGSNGLLYAYYYNTLKPKRVLHLGCRSLFAARFAVEHNIEYVAQTKYKSVYNLLSSREALFIMTISERGFYHDEKARS